MPTTTAVTYEMYLILVVVFTVFSAMLAALAWFIKTQFERTMAKLDDLALQRTRCREELPDRFADKTETKAALTRIFDKSDDHEKRISVLEDRGGRRSNT